MAISEFTRNRIAMLKQDINNLKKKKRDTKEYARDRIDSTKSIMKNSNNKTQHLNTIERIKADRDNKIASLDRDIERKKTTLRD